MDAATISAILAGIGGIITALSGMLVLFRKQNTEDYAALSRSVIEMKDQKAKSESEIDNLRKELSACKSESLNRLYDVDNAHRRIEAKMYRQIIAAGSEPEDYTNDIKKINQIVEDQKNC